MDSRIPDFGTVKELNYYLNNLNDSLKSKNKLKLKDIEKIVKTIADASQSLKTKEPGSDTEELKKLNGRITEFENIVNNGKFKKSNKIKKSLTAISEIRNVLVGKNTAKNPAGETIAKLSSLKAEMYTTDADEIKGRLNEMTQTATSENIQPEDLAELGSAINELNRTSKGQFSEELTTLFNKLASKHAPTPPSTKDSSESQAASETEPPKVAKTPEQIRSDYKAVYELDPTSSELREKALTKILKNFPKTKDKPELKDLKLEITFKLFREEFTTLIQGEVPDRSMIENIKIALAAERSRLVNDSSDLSESLNALIMVVDHQLKHLPSNALPSTQSQQQQAVSPKAQEEPLPASSVPPPPRNAAVPPPSAPAAAPTSPTAAVPQEPVQRQSARPGSVELFARFGKTTQEFNDPKLGFTLENKRNQINLFTTYVDINKDSLSTEKKRELFTKMMQHYLENGRLYSKESLSTISALLGEEKELDALKKKFDNTVSIMNSIIEFPDSMKLLLEKIEKFSHTQEINDLNNQKNQLLVDQSNSKYSLSGLAISGELKQIDVRLQALKADQTKYNGELGVLENEKKELKTALFANFERLFSKKFDSSQPINLEANTATTFHTPNSISMVYRELFNTEKDFLLGLRQLDIFLQSLKTNSDTDKNDLKELVMIVKSTIEFSNKLSKTFEENFENLVVNRGNIQSFDSFDPTKVTNFFKNHKKDLASLVVNGARAIQLSESISNSIRIDKLVELQNAATDSEVKNILQKQIDERKRLLDLFASDSFLSGGDISSRAITPVQRGPRYRLLIEEFAKQTKAYLTALDKGIENPSTESETKTAAHINSLSNTAKEKEKEKYTLLLNEVNSALDEIKQALNIANLTTQAT